MGNKKVLVIGGEAVGVLVVGFGIIHDHDIQDK